MALAAINTLDSMPIPFVEGLHPGPLGILVNQASTIREALELALENAS